MIARTTCKVDEFPTTVLAGFRSMRKATGKYPKKIVLGYNAAKAANMRGGVWEPGVSPGIWRWASDVLHLKRKHEEGK